MSDFYPEINFQHLEECTQYGENSVDARLRKNYTTDERRMTSFAKKVQAGGADRTAIPEDINLPLSTVFAPGHVLTFSKSEDPTLGLVVTELKDGEAVAYINSSLAQLPVSDDTHHPVHQVNTVSHGTLQIPHHVHKNFPPGTLPTCEHELFTLSLLPACPVLTLDQRWDADLPPPKVRRRGVRKPRNHGVNLDSDELFLRWRNCCSCRCWHTQWEFSIGKAGGVTRTCWKCWESDMALKEKRRLARQPGPQDGEGGEGGEGGQGSEGNNGGDGDKNDEGDTGGKRKRDDDGDEVQEFSGKKICGEVGVVATRARAASV